MSAAAAEMSLAQFAASLRAPKIVAMCGSDRAGSLNRKLLACAAGELVKQGAEVEVVDLPALDLPLCKKLKRVTSTGSRVFSFSFFFGAPLISLRGFPPTLFGRCC